MNMSWTATIVEIAVAVVIVATPIKASAQSMRRDTHQAEGMAVYVLEAMLVEGATCEMERAGWRAMDTCVRSLPPDTLLKSPGTKLVKFPDLNLKLGSTTKTNNQHLVRYAKTFDAKLNPLEFQEQGVGQKVRARFVEVKDSSVSLDVQLDDVREPEWVAIKSKARMPEIRQPFFTARSASPKVIIPLNDWYVLGGAIDTTNSTFFVFRVTKK